MSFALHNVNPLHILSHVDYFLIRVCWVSISSELKWAEVYSVKQVLVFNRFLLFPSPFSSLLVPHLLLTALRSCFSLSLPFVYWYFPLWDRQKFHLSTFFWSESSWNQSYSEITFAFKIVKCDAHKPENLVDLCDLIVQLYFFAGAVLEGGR